MPLFSIVIPTFNRLHSLKETVDSVWKQNFTDYELIVIDDGSTDGTANYLSNNSSRIKFKLRRNAGPSAARNAGIDMAVGDYVIFLDSDDLWFPWTLGTYAAAIESHKGPSIIIGSWLEVDAKDLGMLPAVATANKFIAYPDFLEASQHSIFWATNNVAIRRAAIGPSCRFDENMRVF
jgi:glycosyltransferase involved in cell wall biosynthesis